MHMLNISVLWMASVKALVKVEFPMYALSKHKAKQKCMCVSSFILRKNRVGRSDLIFIFFLNFIRNALPYV